MDQASSLRLADREMIKDVLHRYCRGIDRRDVDLLRSCYHENAVDQHASFTGSGYEFCDYAMSQVARTLTTQHRITNVMFEFDGDRAFVESYIHAIHIIDSDGKLWEGRHLGRYCDVFEYRDAAWKIGYRLSLPDSDTICEITEPTGRTSRPQPKEEGQRYYARGVPGGDDPSYLRFNIPSLRRDVPPLMTMMEDVVGRKN